MADVCPHGSCVLSWQMMSALMAAHDALMADDGALVAADGAHMADDDERPLGSSCCLPSWQLMVPTWQMMSVVMVTVIANRPLLPVGL